MNEQITSTEPDLPSPRRASKGIGLTNWLVSRASGLLERRSSRRGFLIGSALAGSAAMVATWDFTTKPGSAYNRITDCGGGTFCTDGWTEFCCGIHGFNTCPPGSFAGGWWRADFSTFCNGTRYYIDCMEHCCGPPLNGSFCAGCNECRCAGDCNTRRVYCNYFRYGQCHTEIAMSGPIACRVVTCVPPYQSDPACINAPAVDNRTAEHAPNCVVNIDPTVPPIAAVLPSSAAVVVPVSGGQLLAAARGWDGAVYTRTLLNGAWTQWFGIGGLITSGIAAASAGSTDYLVVRGLGNAIWVNQRVALHWSGWRYLGGESRSDPSVVADGNAIQIFVRGINDGIWVNRYNGTTATGWAHLGGIATSDPIAVRDGSTTRVFVRGLGNTMWENHSSGGAWSGWNYLEGIAISNASCVSNASGTYVFVRSIDFAVWVNHLSGSTWSGWKSLGGGVTSEPAAVAPPSGPVRVFARGWDNAVYMNYQTGSTWSGWGSLGGVALADPVAVANSSSSHVFVQGTDSGLWFGQLPTAGGWSGWQSLSGLLAPLRAGL